MCDAFGVHRRGAARNAPCCCGNETGNRGRRVKTKHSMPAMNGGMPVRHLANDTSTHPRSQPDSRGLAAQSIPPLFVSCLIRYDNVFFLDTDWMSPARCCFSPNPERDGDGTGRGLHAPRPYPEDSSGGEGQGAQEEEGFFGCRGARVYGGRGGCWCWGRQRQSNVRYQWGLSRSGPPQRHRWSSCVEPNRQPTNGLYRLVFFGGGALRRDKCGVLIPTCFVSGCSLFHPRRFSWEGGGCAVPCSGLLVVLHPPAALGDQSCSLLPLSVAKVASRNVGEFALKFVLWGPRVSCRGTLTSAIRLFGILL